MYEGILEASRQRLSFRKSHRSKSESNVQCNEESEDSAEATEDISTSKKVHCYSKLANYFTKLQGTTSATHISSKAARQGHTTADDVETTKCPAKFHLNQCTCNLEVELKGEPISSTY